MTEVVNKYGKSGEAPRGTWCTPKWLADLIGPVDVDPCSNERSHVQARVRWGEAEDGIKLAPTVPADWSSYINPDYVDVGTWIASYAHTRFMFLLRWDPSTAWFSRLAAVTRYAWFPIGRRIEFEPPPGVKSSSNPYPHALFMREPPNAALRRAGFTLTRAVFQ